MERKDLTHGTVWGNIFTFSLPYMLAYFLQILYGLADLFFIGRYCDVASITAVSNGAQVMYMLTVIIIGLAMGTTVHTARASGADDTSRIALIVGNTATFSAVLSIVLAAVLLLSRGAIVSVMHTPAEAVAGMTDYLTICFSGIPFIVAYNVIASIFRGLGDSKSPMYYVGIACAINIGLDYLLIGHLGMGPSGAACATVISQMVSVLAALTAIRRHRSAIGITRADFSPRLSVLTDILKIGVPVALQDGFIQVAFIAITVIANERGLDDAAAVGIVEKFIGLLFIVPSAMLSTVSAVSAQNIGAGKIDRARATMRNAILISAGFGAVCAITLQFVPEAAVRLFTSDARVVLLGSEYLRGYAWDCMLAGVHFCFSGFFTACGLSIISFCHNFLSIICARIPLSWLASVMYPDTLYPMGLASPTGSLVSIIICTAVYTYMLRHKKFGA